MVIASFYFPFLVFIWLLCVGEVKGQEGTLAAYHLSHAKRAIKRYGKQTSLAV